LKSEQLRELASKLVVVKVAGDSSRYCVTSKTKGGTVLEALSFCCDGLSHWITQDLRGKSTTTTLSANSEYHVTELTAKEKRTLARLLDVLQDCEETLHGNALAQHFDNNNHHS
jgi:hypothetical protein